jgi:hypothetical protein
MTKYKLVKDNTSIDFPSMDAVAVFRLANPEWADIEPVAYTEEPEPVAPVVPDQVTLWQIRTVLDVMGLEATVTAVIQGMPDGPEKKAAWKAWEYANNIKRTSPTVEGLKAILQLTDEQLDQIFIQADLIDA